ncbi:MAG: hypothetical protein C4519_00675 [Desulfobacteraceae bacterium]|nr:MAG: hypothetical protein C4519_00675 [Desulfobacteraceae bacterium]
MPVVFTPSATVTTCLPACAFQRADANLCSGAVRGPVLVLIGSSLGRTVILPQNGCILMVKRCIGRLARAQATGAVQIGGHAAQITNRVDT